ncbi:Muc13, partial [Columba guinea]
MRLLFVTCTSPRYKRVMADEVLRAKQISSSGSSSDTSPVSNSTTITENTESTSETDSTTTLTATTDTTGENNITATTPTTTTAGTTGDFCKPNPCGTNLATCVHLNTTFTCLCQYGFYYRDNDCHRGKIFPGVITLQGTYSDSVLTVNFMQYEEVLNTTTEFFKYAFENLTGYEQTVIVKIQLLTEGRDSTKISVTVINLFMKNTTADNETVTSAVMNATDNYPFVLQYTDSELILIIVGTVLGAVVLLLAIAVTVVSIRVRTTTGHTNPGYQPNNPYEMRNFDDL